MSNQEIVRTESLIFKTSLESLPFILIVTQEMAEQEEMNTFREQPRLATRMSY